MCRTCRKLGSRLGTALRKYKQDMVGKKLPDGKGVGEKGRLTDKIVDSCRITMARLFEKIKVL